MVKDLSPQLPALLRVGKGALLLQDDDTAIQSFIEGVTMGHLAYMTHGSKTTLVDADITLLIGKRQQTTSLLCNYGYIVGFLSTLVQRGNYPQIVCTSFSLGYQEGMRNYCQDGNQRLYTLSDVSSLLTSRHGENSNQHAGYVYGWLECLTDGIHTVKPRIPGESNSSTMPLPSIPDRPSMCSRYGHLWRATNQQGKFTCANCKLTGYCPGCLLATPQGVVMMRCKQHSESQEAK